MEEEENIVTRPKDGNPNFEEVYVTTSHHSNNDKEEDEDDDKYNFGADARIAFETPGLSTYLQEGAPFVPPPAAELSKEALAHLDRQVAMLTDPFVKFLADVAVSSGTSLNQMLAVPSIPLVNTQATSIQTLLSTSAFPRDLMLIVLAKVLLELPVTLTAALKQSQTGGGGGGGSGAGVNGNNATGFVDPNGTPQKVTAQIGDTIASYLASVEPVGVNPFLGAGGGPGANPQQVLSDALMSIQAGSNVLNWTWSQMPEQAGMMLARPEVTSKIQSCFEEIRRLSPAHTQIQLWHLITGPLVRGRFARLVASMLNTVPSEMQYPGYGGVRGNGAVIGSRVTPGIVSQVAHSHQYKSLLAWFKHVTYREAEEWLQVQQRVSESAGVIGRVQSEVDNCERELKLAMKDVWNQLPVEIQENAANLWFHEKLSGAPPQARQEASARRRREFAAIAARQPSQFAKTVGAITDLYLLVPFAGPIGAPVNQRLQDTRNEDIPFPNTRGDTANTISMLRAAGTAIETITKYAPNLQDVSRLLTLSSAIYAMTNALINMRRVIDQQLADRRLYASFDEIRKVELVHREPPPSERIPVRNFLYSRGRW